jgi:hypothetical protein
VTGEEAARQTLINQLGGALLTIADQAGTIAVLQNKLAEANAKIEELEKQPS